LSARGALAVGLAGTAMHFEPGIGWVTDPVPPRASHIHLWGVAYSGPSSAFAVGQLGTILRWDGTEWTEDPESLALTQGQLNAVPFGRAGEGWAAGTFGTTLHFDGNSWSTENPPAEDAGLNITSVAVAGSDVFAVAGGNLIERSATGQWNEVPG